MAEGVPVLERIGRGDRQAVAECLDRYGGLVWSLARRFFPNDADAEEAVQDIFMAIWKAAGRFDPEQAAEATFVSMIARRRLIDRVRKTAREPLAEPLESAAHVLTVDGRETLESCVETQRVLGVMSILKPDHRKIVHMSTWLGMSHGAIAEETGLPLGSVKTILRRSVLKIRDVLGHVEGDL